MLLKSMLLICGVLFMILDLPKVGIVPLFGAVHSASRRISHSQHDERCLVGHLRRNKYHINGRFWRALDWRHFFPPAAGAAEAKATPSSIAPPWHAVLIAAVATTISFQFSSPISQKNRRHYHYHIHNAGRQYLWHSSCQSEDKCAPKR